MQVWSEGYIVTGSRSGATLMGVAPGAKTMGEAVIALARNNKLDPGFLRRDGDRWFYWGCELFDNEADARKKFG